MRTHVPERLLQLQGETRTVEATNSHDNLKVYLYFSEPIVNSSAEVLGSLNISGGDLVSLPGDSLGSRRFGFKVTEFRISVLTLILGNYIVCVHLFAGCKCFCHVNCHSCSSFGLDHKQTGDSCLSNSTSHFPLR
ncbi:hypothetical protein LINPERPRIM_LOCUS18596 [Linum perenne]